MRIIYDASIPPAFVPIIKARLEPIFGYFPGWVQEVGIYYDLANPQKNTLACRANYNYRYVELYIYEEWFTRNEESCWKVAMWHELMHVVFSPYTYVIERAINLFEDGPLKEHIKQEIADAEEFVSQDFAQIIDNLTKTQK